MKTTKNMIIRPSEEARELMLFTINDGTLYRGIITSTIRTLAKHYKRGTYSPEKAIAAYYHIATEASKIYNKYYSYSFTVTERYTAAAELEEYYRENVENNDI